MSLSKKAVDRPTTTLIIFIVVVGLAAYSAISLPLDLFPDIEPPILLVITNYTNAGPEEVERSVTRNLESAVSSVSGLKKVTSDSSSGTSLIIIELNYGSNLDAAAIDLRDRIDMVKQLLPDDVDTPMIMKFDPAMMPIMGYVLTGNRSPEELRKYAEDTVQPLLEQIDGVASVSIVGGREEAIEVSIPRDRLEAYSLSMTQIAQMIAAQNIQASGGIISEGDLDYTINTSGDFASIDDIKRTVISYKVETPTSMTQAPAVRTVKLGEIADVYPGHKTQTTTAYVNGIPGVVLYVQKQSGKNSVQTAQKTRDQIEKLKQTMPHDMNIVEGMNMTDIIENSISQVSGSAIQGAVLAILVLLVFLRSLRSTIIIGLTIPISLIITLGCVYFAGFTLNIMTLAGLALGVGMLVDNSIVILENIYSYRERGAKPSVAAILGSQEMVMAITSSTLTTICVFLPLILYQAKLGVIGQVFQGLTFTVVFSLVSSLIVAILLVPVLSSKYLKIGDIKKGNRTGFIGKIDNALGKSFESLDNAYARTVRFVLHNRKKTLMVIGFCFLGSILLAFKLGFVFMPSQEADSVRVTLTMPEGTRLDVTETVVRQLENFAMQEVKGYDLILSSVGGDMMFGSAVSNVAGLQIKLPPYAKRIDNAETIKNKLRAHFNKFPGAQFVFVDSGMSMGGGASGIDIMVKSDDLDIARDISYQIKDVLEKKATEYITEPTISLKDGLPRANVVIDREKLYNLGLNIYSVSNEIKANINGITATKFRNKGDETDIVVRLDERDRKKLTDLESIFVINSAGNRIPLSNFAYYVDDTSPVTISRENQRRIVHVTATPAKGVSLGKIQTEIERLIAENIPIDDSFIIEYGGDYKDLFENIIQFVIIITMAIILVFAVMASLFESFLDPFIVIFTIPLSIIGIVLVYFIFGQQLNVITAVGVLVLVGVIVNNGIVLVDYTNLMKKRGLPLEEACVEAAKSRLRPVLMTTLTTVLALIPMAFFPGEGSELVQPIGMTVFGGLTFGTMMTLFLMPTMYYIFHSHREKRLLRKQSRTKFA